MCGYIYRAFHRIYCLYIGTRERRINYPLRGIKSKFAPTRNEYIAYINS